MTLGRKALGKRILAEGTSTINTGQVGGTTYKYADGVCSVALNLVNATGLVQASNVGLGVTMGCFGSVQKIGPNGDDAVPGIWVPDKPADTPTWTPDTSIPGGLA